MKNPLYACKTCGQTIAKSARRCPHCGAKNKKRRPLLLLIVAIAVIMIAVHSIRSNKTQSITPAPVQTQSIPTEDSYTPKPDSPPTAKVPAPEQALSTDKTPPSNTPAPTESPVVPTEPAVVGGLRPEFVQAMDSYEAFYSEYCEFMTSFSQNPTDFSMLADYASLMSRAEAVDEAFEAWDEDEMSTEELKYFMDVNNRVMQMLADVTY